MGKRVLNPPRNFEEALSELEEILAAVEAGQISLEESLLKYERGNFLIAYCRTILSSAEKQIEQLTQDAAGNLVSTPVSEPGK